MEFSVVETANKLEASEERRPSEESASSYCPVCSQRLEARKCKLLCLVCGYYMSCSDYY